MERQLLQRLFWTAAGILVAFFCGVPAAAASYEPGRAIHYTTRVGAHFLWSTIPPSLGAVRAAMQELEWTLLACMACGLVTLVATRKRQASELRCIVSLATKAWSA